MKTKIALFLALVFAVHAEDDLDALFKKKEKEVKKYSPTAIQTEDHSPAPGAGETKTVVAPEVKHEPKLERPKLYKEGEFPKGTIYKVPDLKDLKDQPIQNGWLIGTFKVLKVLPGQIVVQTVSVDPTLGLLPIMEQDGSTLLEINYYKKHPSFVEGSTIRFDETVPLKLVKVTTYKGRLIASTQYLRDF